MGKITRRLYFSLCALCCFLIAMLIFHSIGYNLKQSSDLDRLLVLSSFDVNSLAEEQCVSLPHTFTNIDKQSDYSLKSTIAVKQSDCLYIKSVYTPMEVYANDTLIYKTGDVGSYPKFIQDPPTTVSIVPLNSLITFNNIYEQINLEIKLQSPASRSKMIVYPLLLGNYSDINQYLFNQMGPLLLISIIEILIGAILIVMSIFAIVVERKSGGILWIGLFSLSSGFWSFGECNLTQLYIHNPVLLYMFAFLGLLCLSIPLIRFCELVINFKSKGLINIVLIINLILLSIALVLQFSGIASFSSTVYVFHYSIIISFIILAICIFYEAIHFNNVWAKRMFIPIATITLFSVLEVVNYNFRFTNILSLIFQCGLVSFIIMSCFISGLFVHDSLKIRSNNQKLEYEIKLIEHSLDEQKKYNRIIIRNTEIVKAQRHDLKHQLAVIKNYLTLGKYTQLCDYVSSLISQIPVDNGSNYCENQAVNGVIMYYAAIAKDNNIDLSITINIPMQLPNLKDTELCVVFGNLLENGIEACNRMTNGHKFIDLKARVRYETLTIVMDNSFDGNVNIIENTLISSKRDEPGIGTSSIDAVAKKHDGSSKFEHTANIFKSSIYMNI